jgi:hypothetical protein
MNQKIEITKYLAKAAGLPTDDKSMRAFVIQWWQNPRNKSKGGLRLTDEGFARLTAHFKAHRVTLDGNFDYNNQLIVRLDNYITCPWYLGNQDIFVFNDKMAVQLVLFSGNIGRFSSAKAASIKNQLTKS